MKSVRIISTLLGTSAMFLMFYIATPVLRAQEEHQQDAKPAAGQSHDQETKPTEDSAKPTPSRPAKADPKDEKRPEDSKAPKENAPRDNNNRQSQTETRTQTETKTTVKHGPIENGRIPDAQFHSHFGRTHTFHVGHPQMVGGQYRVNYGGYWFGWSEAWPAGWGYDDDVYVDFIDGQYYLIDLSHPQARIALIIVE